MNLEFKYVFENIANKEQIIFYRTIEDIENYQEDFEEINSNEKYKLIGRYLYTGIKDNCGEKIFQDDVVYIAGIGNTIMEFPFIELHKALAENGIGNIIREYDIVKL